MKLPVALVAALLAASPVSPGWAQVTGQEPLRIVITKQDCIRLLRHTPRPDVTYQPGTDHKGRKVAPADLPGSGAANMPDLVPDVLEIPLSAKVMSGAGYATHGLGDSQTTLGTVKYDLAKGTFTLNGQPLGGAEQEELAVKCRGAGLR